MLVKVLHATMKSRDEKRGSGVIGGLLGTSGQTGHRISFEIIHGVGCIRERETGVGGGGEEGVEGGGGWGVCGGEGREGDRETEKETER